MRNYNKKLYEEGVKTWVRDEDVQKIEYHDRVEWFIDDENGLTIPCICNSYEHALETIKAMGKVGIYTIRKYVTPYEEYYGFN